MRTQGTLAQLGAIIDMRELRRRIKNRFDREGISIAFPQRAVYLVEAELLAPLLAARREESHPAGS